MIPREKKNNRDRDVTSPSNLKATKKKNPFRRKKPQTRAPFTRTGQVHHARASTFHFFLDKKKRGGVRCAPALLPHLSTSPRALMPPRAEYIPPVCSEWPQFAAVRFSARLVSAQKNRCPRWFFSKEFPEFGSVSDFCPFLMRK